MILLRDPRPNAAEDKTQCLLGWRDEEGRGPSAKRGLVASAVEGSTFLGVQMPKEPFVTGFLQTLAAMFGWPCALILFEGDGGRTLLRTSLVRCMWPFS